MPKHFVRYIYVDIENKWLHKMTITIDFDL